MGTQLMKHEYLRTRSGAGLILGASIALVLVGALAGKTGWPFVSPLGGLMAIIGIMAVLPVTQIYLAIDYWRNSYRRTGYFTQTLPIAGGTIFGVKLIWGLIVNLAAAVVCGLLLLFFLRFGVGAFGFDGAALWSQVTQMWGIIVATWPWWLWVTAAIILFTMVIANLVFFYFAASIGSQEPLNRHGVGGPILVVILGYVAQQFLFMVAIISIPFGLDIADGAPQLVHINWLSEMLSNGDGEGIPVGFALVYLVLPIVLIAWTRRSWNRKISLA